jgi:hypothetical protein
LLIDSIPGLESSLKPTRIGREVRAYPWSGCYTRWQGKVVKVLGAIALFPSEKVEPRRVIFIALSSYPEVPVGVGTGKGIFGLRPYPNRLESCRPPKRCMCRCATNCPPSEPQLTTIRYPLSERPSFFARSFAMPTILATMERSFSLRSVRAGMCFLGTTRICVGAWGLISRKAMTSSS